MEIDIYRVFLTTFHMCTRPEGFGTWIESCYIEEEETEHEEVESEVIQVVQSQAEEPTKTPVYVANDEPVASRTRSQTAAS